MCAVQTGMVILQKAIKWLIWISMIKGVYTLLFRLTAKWDAKGNGFHVENKIGDEVDNGAFLVGTLTVFVTDRMWQMSCSVWQELLRLLPLGIINGCFLFATIMDLRIQKVYHFVWWIAGGAAVFLWFFENGGQLAALLGFWLLQQTLFTRFYGKADSHAFSVCAVLMAALNGTVEDVWLHMIIAFVMLFLVQLQKGNVDRYGRLKKPVPFIPYIWSTFWFYPGWFIHAG